ncbi:Hypothetical protein SCF082_LOCUS40803, partial [Durusdinium trenchii]
AFTKHLKNGDIPETDSGKAQKLVIPAQWRFWWGPLTEMPPLPLGADDQTKCYSRVIFGRELLRTGLGGFVTPRVVTFYHKYLDMVFARSREGLGNGFDTNDAELKMYRAMGTGFVPRHDAASLSRMAPGSEIDLNYFTTDGFKLLSQRPALLPREKKEGESTYEDETEVQLTQSPRPESKAPVRHVNVLW